MNKTLKAALLATTMTVSAGAAMATTVGHAYQANITGPLTYMYNQDNTTDYRMQQTGDTYKLWRVQGGGYVDAVRTSAGLTGKSQALDYFAIYLNEGDVLIESLTNNYYRLDSKAHGLNRYTLSGDLRAPVAEADITSGTITGTTHTYVITAGAADPYRDGDRLWNLDDIRTAEKEPVNSYRQSIDKVLAHWDEAYLTAENPIVLFDGVYYQRTGFDEFTSATELTAPAPVVTTLPYTITRTSPDGNHTCSESFTIHLEDGTQTAESIAAQNAKGQELQECANAKQAAVTPVFGAWTYTDGITEAEWDSGTFAGDDDSVETMDVMRTRTCDPCGSLPLAEQIETEEKTLRNTNYVEVTNDDVTVYGDWKAVTVDQETVTVTVKGKPYNQTVDIQQQERTVTVYTVTYRNGVESSRTVKERSKETRQMDNDLSAVEAQLMAKALQELRVAQAALERGIINDLNGIEMVGETPSGLKIFLMLDAGGVGVAKDYRIGEHLVVTPRGDIFGLGKDYTGVALSAEAKYELDQVRRGFSVGLDTGKHFRAIGDVDGFKSVRAEGRSSDAAAFVEYNEQIGENGKASMRLDHNGNTQFGYEHKYNDSTDVSITVDNEERIQAGVKVRF